MASLVGNTSEQSWQFTFFSWTGLGVTVGGCFSLMCCRNWGLLSKDSLQFEDEHLIFGGFGGFGVFDVDFGIVGVEI